VKGFAIYYSALLILGLVLLAYFAMQTQVSRSLGL
jgi:hypothetical protein